MYRIPLSVPSECKTSLSCTAKAHLQKAKTNKVVLRCLRAEALCDADVTAYECASDWDADAYCGPSTPLSNYVGLL